MKKFKYINLALLLTGVLFGCSDEFLDRPPTDAIVDANFYQSTDQVLAGSAPLYNIVWFAYNDKASHGLGDARGGVLASGSYQVENTEFRTTGTTGEVTNAWRSFFNIVGQSNLLIRNLNLYVGAEVPESIKQHAIAEARFMRGVAYSYLTMNWGPVPIIEDNTELLTDTSTARNTEESVWQFIIKDLRFAAENLPESPVLEGRLTRYAAEGMLAKMYLIRSGLNASPGNRNQNDLDSARILAKDVILNSGATLLPDYEDLFKTVNNNNSESLFALQWVYNHQNYTQYGVQNSVQAYLAYGSSITGFGDGWGGDIGASWFMLDKYEGLIETGVTDDERRKATFMFPGDNYDYISQQVVDAETGDIIIQDLVVPTGSTDSIGQQYAGRPWVKKYVVGRPEDNNGEVLQQGTGINTYMLRLADVYLIYAEATLGNQATLSSGDALDYFNKVRERAGLDPLPTLTWEDIFKERIVEFAMEGQVWYEYIRLHYYNPQEAYTRLSNQDRGFVWVYPDDVDNATSWRIAKAPNDNTRTFNVNSGNFRLPIPEAEASRAPNLRKPPVPYDFGTN